MPPKTTNTATHIRLKLCIQLGTPFKHRFAANGQFSPSRCATIITLSSVKCFKMQMMLVCKKLGMCTQFFVGPLFLIVNAVEQLGYSANGLDCNEIVDRFNLPEKMFPKHRMTKKLMLYNALMIFPYG